MMWSKSTYAAFHCFTMPLKIFGRNQFMS